jgi:solute carrier family 35 (UDP-sugar transporter), member A1/2/3
MLNRTLSLQKWVSLILLTLGVALVQLPSSTAGPPATEKESFFHKHFHFTARALTGGLMHHQDKVSVHVEDGMNASLGLAAVFAACMLSGLAGVYFEKVLKGSNATLWVRNVQLSFFSLFPAFFVGVLWKDGAQVFDKVRSPPTWVLGRVG